MVDMAVPSFIQGAAPWNPSKESRAGPVTVPWSATAQIIMWVHRDAGGKGTILKSSQGLDRQGAWPAQTQLQVAQAKA